MTVHSKTPFLLTYTIAASTETSRRWSALCPDSLILSTVTYEDPQTILRPLSLTYLATTMTNITSCCLISSIFLKSPIRWFPWWGSPSVALVFIIHYSACETSSSLSTVVLVCPRSAPLSSTPALRSAHFSVYRNPLTCHCRPWSQATSWTSVWHCRLCSPIYTTAADISRYLIISFCFLRYAVRAQQHETRVHLHTSLNEVFNSDLVSKSMKKWRSEEVKKWRNEEVKKWGNERMKNWTNEEVKTWRSELLKKWRNEEMKEMKKWTNEEMK